MSFIETLRIARESRVAVLHEFWTQYAPRERRVHAFFEGHDDIVFFCFHIERILPDGFRLLPYRCEGKARVFEVYSEITRRVPDMRLALFFVDKDLDDVLGAPWPTDPRIFVTDVYSIENYLVATDVLMRLYRSGVRITGVTFDEGVIAKAFDRHLTHFHRRILGVMAWILVVRRGGARPNLNNVDMYTLFRISESGEPCPIRGGRLAALNRSTGVRLAVGLLSRVREASRELARVPPKRIVRGKFEGWFFVEFWNCLVAQLRTVAIEGGGKVHVRIALTHSTLVTVLSQYVETPRPLELFLKSHLSGLDARQTHREEYKAPKGPLWRRIVALFRK